jgi:hypothetical protein
VRPARPRQASPQISDSRASGYSQPISGPNRPPASFAHPPELPRNPPALYRAPGAPAGPAKLAVRPPPNDATEPGTDIPKRSRPLYPNTMATALLSVDPST